MEILNTIPAHVGGVSIFFGIVSVVLTILCFVGFIVAVEGDEGATAILLLLVTVGFALTARGCFTTPDVPERYEVIVREGNVIDARQYDIIEQRGQIYVIQAREQTE